MISTYAQTVHKCQLQRNTAVFGILISAMSTVTESCSTTSIPTDETGSVNLKISSVITGL